MEASEKRLSLSNRDRRFVGKSDAGREAMKANLRRSRCPAFGNSE